MCSLPQLLWRIQVVRQRPIPWERYGYLPIPEGTKWLPWLPTTRWYMGSWEPDKTRMWTKGNSELTCTNFNPQIWLYSQERSEKRGLILSPSPTSLVPCSHFFPPCSHPFLHILLLFSERTEAYSPPQPRPYFDKSIKHNKFTQWIASRRMRMKHSCLHLYNSTRDYIKRFL